MDHQVLHKFLLNPVVIKVGMKQKLAFFPVVTLYIYVYI